MNNDLNDIINRIEKLEKALFAAKNKTKAPKKSSEMYTGPRGGVLLLIDDGMLNSPKTVDEVKQEIEKRDFYYQRSVIQTAMNRLANPKGPLTCFEKGGKKVYVIRK